MKVSHTYSVIIKKSKNPNCFFDHLVIFKFIHAVILEILLLLSKENVQSENVIYLVKTSGSDLLLNNVESLPTLCYDLIFYFM